VGNIVGLISIKDIFEDIMQEEIIDEDMHLDSTLPNNLNFKKRSSISKNIELKSSAKREPLLE
jgi:CBS domain containing-hemolysin-like protein